MFIQNILAVVVLVAFFAGLVGSAYLFVRYRMLLSYLGKQHADYLSSLLSGAKFGGELRTFTSLNKSVSGKLYERSGDADLTAKCNEYRKLLTIVNVFRVVLFGGIIGLITISEVIRMAGAWDK